MVQYIDPTVNRIRYTLGLLENHLKSDEVALEHDQLVERKAASNALAKAVIATRSKIPRQLTENELMSAAKMMIEALNKMRTAFFLVGRVFNDLKASEEYIKNLPKRMTPEDFNAALETFNIEFTKIVNELSDYMRFWKDVESNLYTGKNITRKWFHSRQYRHFSRHHPRDIIKKIFREEMQLDKHLLGLMDATMESFSRQEIAGFEKGIRKKKIV